MEILKSYFSSIDPMLFNHVSGKPREFIDLFRSENFLNEKVFEKALCGENYNERYYSELKSRTIKILQALVIISDEKGEILVNKNFHKAQKKFLLGHKFLTKGQREEGIRVIKQAYKIAVDFDFSHLACELASILYHDHVYYNRNKRVATFYANKMKFFLNNYSAEKEAEYFFFNVVGNAEKLTSADLLKKAYDNIAKIKRGSTKYKVYAAILNVLCGFYSGEHKRVIEVCNETLNYFEGRKGVYNSQYYFFIRNKGTAETALGRYEEANRSYERAEKYADNKPHNHCTLQFCKTLNALHAGQYETAYNLYQKNKRCKIESIRQQFAIVEAYLYFLYSTGHLNMNKKFRLGKYLNETFNAQKNKEVDNVNIIIAELLVYLVKNRGKFIDRIESVQDYSKRHLKSKETRRARWFIKILCLMAHPKVNFHPVALQRRAKQFIYLLKKNPARLGENFSGEIIPFEQLLDMIIEKVMKKAA